MSKNTIVNSDDVENDTGFVSRREAAWQAQAIAVATAIETLGRMPHVGDTGIDASMLRWIRRQQWALRQDILHPTVSGANRLGSDHELWLDDIPHWQWNPRLEKWFHNASEVRGFYLAVGSLPSARRADSEARERKLGYWLENERRKPRTQFTSAQLTWWRDLENLWGELDG